jgi:monoterpene epsilon-lactone hydrolase
VPGSLHYAAQMPSLQHALATRVVPLLRRNPPADDLEKLRSTLVAANRTADEAPPPRVRRGHEEQIGNVHGFPVYRLWQPLDDQRPTRSVFFLHGGAYVRPAAAWHWRFLVSLADQLQARAVLPAYPLAPEFTVEDSFEDMVRLFEEVAADSPGGVVLVGDSAGGGYALALAEALRDRGAAQPDRLVLVAPWVDLTGSAPGTREAALHDPWLSFRHMSIYAEYWAGSDDPAVLADPRVSPGLGDLAGLPPALMFCGTRDLLKPACDVMFERADAADWELEYVVGPGLMHDYPVLPIPEARTAMRSIVEFCRRED